MRRYEIRKGRGLGWEMGGVRWMWALTMSSWCVRGCGAGQVLCMGKERVHISTCCSRACGAEAKAQTSNPSAPLGAWGASKAGACRGGNGSVCWVWGPTMRSWWLWGEGG